MFVTSVCSGNSATVLSLFSLAGLFWMMLPFFEKNAPPPAPSSYTRTTQIRTLTRGLSVFALAYVLWMTINGFIAK